ncbi:Hypothetical protein CINCED_3A018464 [Cinara cedri]|nr:Hypothetical protein CINCED_3A018464 [Cinara cedri]
MVLYTLAVNHPAFLFEQKTQLDSIFNCIKKEKERQLSKNKGVDQDTESTESLESINTMIPPPNFMYQPAHGGSNYPLNRNGYLYPRHYYPFPPMNVPPMQVCYDYPPPSAVSAIPRAPHQPNFAKSSSPVSWHPRTFQINPRNQPPNASSKQRHPTPPRYRSPPDPTYPFAQSWNNWNMYQMSPHNMYTHYNYPPGMVPSYYPENTMGRSYQGYGSKSKYSTVNRSQDQYRSQVPTVPVSTTPNKTDNIDKSTKPIFANATTNTPAENEPIVETASSSKSTEVYHQSSSSTIINSAITDNADCPQPIVENSSIFGGPNTVQSTTDATENISKTVFENKAKDDKVVPTTSKVQSELPKTFTPSTNSQEAQCSDITVQSSTSQGPSNELDTTIDLSSLSAELEDGKLTEEKYTSVDNKSNSDCQPQNSKIPLQHETNVRKEYGVKGMISDATTNSISTPVTTAAYNTQGSKYYKGRPIQSQPIQSQPRPTIRDGNLNNSYNSFRKPVSGLVQSYNEPARENAHRPHPKIPNNGQQYYTMSYDNGASARPYNTQTYYVHQPQTSQPMTSYSSVPRPYLPQQHIVQSPEYQQVYQQPEFLYYPSSSQTFYTTPVLMQPQVLAYHPPKVSCYNCGGQNHTGAECTELTMEELTSKGLYETHYGPPMPDGRPHN